MKPGIGQKVVFSDGDFCFHTCIYIHVLTVFIYMYAHVHTAVHRELWFFDYIMYMYMYMYKAITLTYNVLYMTFCSLIQLIPVMNADTKSWHKWPKKYNSAYKSIRRMYMYMYIVYIIIYIYIYTS